MDSPDVLDVLQDILETERSFHSVIPSLNEPTRNHIIAAHMRNVSTALAIVRHSMLHPQTTTMVMNIPLSIDASGNFFDPVTVAPTRAQIAAALEIVEPSPNTNCSICQDVVEEAATRIHACGHTFHAHCLTQWLNINPRCPVCRHDVRDLQPPTTDTTNE